MYEVLTACIDQVIRFNTEIELKRFLDGLDARKQQKFEKAPHLEVGTQDAQR